MECGGLNVVEALSPIEEGKGILHWDTYMPYVSNENWVHYEAGRESFAKGSFTSDKDLQSMRVAEYSRDWRHWVYQIRVVLMRVR